MLKAHWALAVMILGIVPPAWGQDAQGSFFHRTPPAPAVSPAADPAPSAVEAAPVPASKPTPPDSTPPFVAQPPPAPAPAASIQTESKPAIDRCGSNPKNVLQFLRFFFANGSGSTGVVIGYQELIYANQVNYYGKVTSRAAVLKEKKAYLDRWPIRTYTLRGNGDIRCDEATGTYDFAGVVDWTASSPSISNGAVKSGAAIVRLGISASPGNTFKILREDSEVTERRLNER